MQILPSNIVVMHLSAIDIWMQAQQVLRVASSISVMFALQTC
jgi:hypothetical protein